MNNMTIEQINEAIAANAELGNQLAGQLLTNNDIVSKVVMPKLTEAGFSIRSKDDETAFVASIESSLRPKLEAEIIPANDKKHYTAIEALVFETTGIAKEANERATDYLKRATTAIKTQSVSDPVVKAQLEAIQNELRTSKTAWEAEKADLISKHQNEKVTGFVKSALKGLNFNVPVTLSDDEKAKYSQAQSDLISNAFSKFTAKFNDSGEIMFFDGDIPFINSKNGKALQPEEIIAERFGYLLAKETQQQAGAGSGQKKNAKGETIYSTKESVFEALKAEGLKENEKAFMDEYRKRCAKSGLI